jgi:hypothetical protein
MANKPGKNVSLLCCWVKLAEIILIIFSDNILYSVQHPPYLYVLLFLLLGTKTVFQRKRMLFKKSSLVILFNLIENFFFIFNVINVIQEYI